MPPKKSAFTFKPKLVTRDADEEGDAEHGDGDVTLLQLHRLDLQRREAEAAEVAAATSASARERGHVPGAGGAQPPMPSGAAGGGAGGGANAGSSPSHGPGGATGGRGAGAPMSAGAAAAARRAAATGLAMDVSGYPEEAERLPRNTARALALPGSGGDPMLGVTYPPTPLEARHATAGADPEGEDADAVTSASSPPPLTDGTAFLREEEEERKRICAANKVFYDSVIAPAVAGSSGTSVGEEKLVWMQMPHFDSPTSPFSLSNLASGKVGELKVLRSGRMLLEVRGVYYDVSVHGGSGDRAVSHLAAVAAATDKNSASLASQGGQAKCFELGGLEHKLVCTPTIGK